MKSFNEIPPSKGGVTDLEQDHFEHDTITQVLAFIFQ